jgi:hypothetical protein
VLQNREVDLTIAEPDAIIATLLRLPEQALQFEVLFVEFGGPCLADSVPASRMASAANLYVIPEVCTMTANESLPCSE